MQLAAIPAGTTDWSDVPASVEASKSGTATIQVRRSGDMQLRRVAYSSGYAADHWCRQGHIVFVIAGCLAIEHDDGRCFVLSRGAVYHVGDDETSPHRVICETGATVFIVD
jgi:hypothetical protein